MIQCDVCHLYYDKQFMPAHLEVEYNQNYLEASIWAGYRLGLRGESFEDLFAKEK